MPKLLGMMILMSLCRACVTYEGGTLSLGTGTTPIGATGFRSGDDSGALTVTGTTGVEMTHYPCESPDVPQAKDPPDDPQVELGLSWPAGKRRSEGQSPIYAAGGCPTNNP